MVNKKRNFISINISSSNRKSALIFFKGLNKNKLINSPLLFKKTSARNYLVSVLKSPHVNKIAQEQFCKKTHFYNLTVDLVGKSNKIMLLLKCLRSAGSADLNFSIRLNNCPVSLKYPSVVDPDFYLKVISKEPKRYLNVLDTYGEVLNCKIKKHF